MKLRSYLLAAAAALALAGCGGGSGGGTAAVPLSGTTAIGTPLAGATVELRDAVGTNVDLSTTADASGRFTFPNVSGLTAPFMLRATGTVAGRQHTLYSFSQTLPTSGVLNATPLTNAVVQAALPPGQTLNGAFAASSLNDDAVSSTELANAIRNLQEALRAVFTALDVPANTNPFTNAFAADHAGLDRLLDLFEFHAEDDSLQVVMKGRPEFNVTVSVSPVANIAPMPVGVSGAIASVSAVDLSLLPRFVERMNAWLAQPASGRTLDTFDDFLHEDFLDYGENPAVFHRLINSFFVNGNSLRLAGYAVDGCQAARTVSEQNAFVCNLSFGVEDLNASGAVVRIESLEIPAIFVSGAAQPWRLYGNQMWFSAEFDPVVSLINDRLSVGFNFSVDVMQPNPLATGTRNASAATITFQDGIRVLSTFSLVRNNACDYLIVSGSQCNNKFTLPSEQISALNAAQSAGTLTAVMAVTFDGGSVPVVHTPVPVRQPFFTEASGRAAADEAVRSFNLQGLGTPTITFSGSNIGHLMIFQGLQNTFVADDWFDVQSLRGTYTAPLNNNVTGIFAVSLGSWDRNVWFTLPSQPQTP